MKDQVTVETIKPLVEENLLQDGFLHPVAFVCGKDGAGILDIAEGIESPETKNNMVTWLCEIVKEYDAHKVILVSEAWAYEAPEGMSIDEIKKIAADGGHRDAFIKKEIYQITEITRDHVTGYVREFSRTEDNEIVLGKEKDGGEAQLDRFLPIQEALTQLQ